MITFDHVTKKYRTNIGLDDVCVKINKGDFVFLVGPSGAGKSTFIKLILKEINADKGTIKVGNFDVTKLSNREVPQFRRKLGTVFQDFRLLPKKTVYENVAFAMEVVHKSSRQIRKQVPQVLSLVGISDKAHKYPDELSAGEQQRVAIARAIVNNPQVLIADEPTGNLDPDTAWEIMDLLEQINMRGTTIVMVTHAKNIVDEMNKRVIAIEAGRIVRDETGAYGYDADESGFDYYDEEDGQMYDRSGAVFGSNDVDNFEAVGLADEKNTAKDMEMDACVDTAGENEESCQNENAGGRDAACENESTEENNENKEEE